MDGPRHRFVRLPSVLTILLVAAGSAVIGAAPAVAAAQSATDINPDVSNNSDADATTGGRVNGLAVVAGDANTAYAASEWGGLFLTKDGGQSWRHLDGHQPQAMWDVEVDPGNSGNVYASSFFDGRTSSVSGIQVSHDGGATWSHPASATPGTGTPCGTTARTEPAAFGISIRPDQPATVYVGTNCGLARSTDSGANWTFLDPTGTGTARQVRDVVAQAGGTVDVCGNDGFFHSADGGTTWTQAAVAPPSGQCSLAASPDEPYVVLASAGVSIWETDDAANAAGATWTQLGSPESRPQGRIPFVATNQRADSGGNNVFDLWFGDVRLYRGGCTTPATPAPGGALRCPAGRIPPIVGNPGPPAGWAGPFTRSAGAHDDAGDIAFNPTVTVDACPILFSSDGGMHRNTDTGGDCHNPDWAKANVGMHAEWLWGMGASDAPGATAENLGYGMQDAGVVFTTDAGANPPTWNEPSCCDIFDVIEDDERAIWTTCCFSSAPATRLHRSNLDGTGDTVINQPGTSIVGFTPTDSMAFFGEDDMVLVDSSGVFVTTDIGANPVVWTQIGTASTPAAACGITASASSTGTPVFYLQVNNCDNRGGSQLWRYSGISPGGTWDRVDDNIGPGGVGVNAVDPSDPNRLYAVQTQANPRMVRSTDSGQTWTPDPRLDAMMTGNGAFAYRTTTGPTDFTGFNGYVQPTLLAFDPDDPNTIVAGGHDSGVFISTDDGTTWSLMTDPLTPHLSGKPHLPQPRFGYFDHEAGSPTQIYIGTQGRGAWRLTPSNADLSITKNARPDPAIAGEQLYYDVTVRNDGPDSAPNVTVSDQLPSQVTFVTSTGNCVENPAGSGTLTCDLGTIASGTSKSFTIKTAVKPDAIAGTGPTSISNTASVRSGGAVDPDPSDNAVTETSLVEDSADVRVDKLCKPDTTIPAGTVVQCTVFVTNNGPSFARNVVVDDTVLSASGVTISAITPSQGSCAPVTAVTGGQKFTCTLGTLAAASPTSTGQATVTYRFVSAEGQDVNNVATVRSATPDPDLSNNRAELSLTVTAVANLGLTKTDSPDPVVAGETMSWTLSVTNGGPSTARNVVVRDLVPAGTSVGAVSVGGGPGSCIAGVPGDATRPTTCTFDSLVNGATRTMTITVRVLPETTGLIHNDASVASDTVDPDNSNNLAHADTTVKTRAKLTISKEARAGTLGPVAGMPLDYVITVTNDGGPSVARTVRVTDTLPDEVRFTGVEVSRGTGTCVQVVGAPYDVRCELADLAPGGYAVVTIHTTVLASTPHVTDIVNTATATSSTPDLADSANQVTAAVTVTIARRADLQIVKTSSADNYKPSAMVDYTVTVTNLGPSDSPATTFVDTLPPAKIAPYISDSGNGTCTFNAGANTLTCAVPALAPGGSYSVNVYVRVKGNKGTITNTVNVNAPSYDPVNANNTAVRQVLIKGGI
jgi:uncharacterized repeat protein (TIGR01451 family)